MNILRPRGLGAEAPEFADLIHRGFLHLQPTKESRDCDAAGTAGTGFRPAPLIADSHESLFQTYPWMHRPETDQRAEERPFPAEDFT